MSSTVPGRRLGERVELMSTTTTERMGRRGGEAGVVARLLTAHDPDWGAKVILDMDDGTRLQVSTSNLRTPWVKPA